MTTNANNDSDDLEALFDSIASENKEAEAPVKKAPAKKVAAKAELGAEADANSEVINKIGHMTRALHDSLRELGLDKNLEKAANAIPDARDRLAYIATMTQQAAERVLNATDAAQPVVDKIGEEAKSLSGEWQKLFDQKLDAEQFKQLAMRTHAYLVEVPKQTKATNAYLTEIMMAQDFQDLTGQVIKKTIEVTQHMEQQLLAILVENAPASAKIDSGLLNGPVIKAGGDVVTSQAQVDDLLESLGF
ncbi:MAG: protein phosphatase CheZ [Gallionellaceae bacterium]|nr:protein phosphatase CheZ [Gallionellaceae bacterium]